MNKIVDGGKKLFLCSAPYAPVQQKNAPDTGGNGGSSVPPLGTSRESQPHAIYIHHV